tara:strand:- start:545 stop:937 length:393 start_codon:yes stop_codon:yes gene_type:complete
MEDLNIRHFKLTNGEDIVAVVSVKNDDSWLLERPVLVNPNLLGGYQFTPWFPFSKTKVFKVLFSNIINSTGIDADVKESYLQYVLEYKKQMTKIEDNQQFLAEMEAEIDQRAADLYEEGNLFGKKKRTIH